MPDYAFEARPLTQPSGQPLEQLPVRGAHDLAAKDSIDNTAQAPFPTRHGAMLVCHNEMGVCPWEHLQ